MTITWNPIEVLNLTLCIVILILGFLGFTRNRNPVSVYLSIAFGLFGISHLMTLFRGEAVLDSILFITRIVAYLLVIIALYKTAFEGNG
jgi:hypothetical protein